MKIQQSLIPAMLGDSSTQKSSASSVKTESFSNILEKSVEKVNSLQKQADVAIDELILGDNGDVVQTMIMMEKADISFRLMTQIRNKIIQAYEEVMRMQV